MMNSFFVLTLMSSVVMSFIFLSSSSLMVFLLMIFLMLFFWKNQHLTILLVQLEILGLMSLFLISSETIFKEKELMFLFTLMVVVVIEASLGLSLIVKQARHLNKEFFKFSF